MDILGFAIATVLFIMLLDRVREVHRLNQEKATTVVKTDEGKAQMKRYALRLLLDEEYYWHEAETVRVAIQNGKPVLDLVERLAEVAESDLGDPNRPLITREIECLLKPKKAA